LRPDEAVIGHDDLCHPESRRLPFTAEGWQFKLKREEERARRCAASGKLYCRFDPPELRRRTVTTLTPGARRGEADRLGAAQLTARRL
jgi:hypothetical protein